MVMIGWILMGGWKVLILIVSIILFFWWMWLRNGKLGMGGCGWKSKVFLEDEKEMVCL